MNPSHLSPSSLTPVRLRCDACENPLGIDSANPRLSWQLSATTHSAIQSAWQLRVSSTREDLGDLWDSGKVPGDEQLSVRYDGKPLRSSQSVFWKVRVWDGHGIASAWSERATWSMGVLTPEDWCAKWISQAASSRSDENRPMVAQRIVQVGSNLSKALLFICGQGQHFIEINGHRAGTNLITPGWTAVEKTCLYDTLDLSGAFHRGPNTVQITVAGGMYRVPDPQGRYRKFIGEAHPYQLIAQLRLEYADGSVETIGTDEKWEIGVGPVTYAHIYGGEEYDARIDPGGWNAPQLTDGPGGMLKGTSHSAPDITAHETLPPIQITKIGVGTYVYDFGQNASIIPRLAVEGPAGSSVRIIPAELLKADGSVERSSVGGGDCWWKFTLRGGGAEHWFPRFFYHGARYLQVELQSGDALPCLRRLDAIVVHSASPAVGSFACSDDLFNRIHRLIRWAQRSNLMSLITDCPHRERFGWLEQYHLNGPALRCEFDLTRLYRKCFHDMADAQIESGLIPNIAPEFMLFWEVRDSPEWASALILAAWQHYVWTGDDAPLFRHYDAMRRYLSYLGSRATDHIINFGLGDWFDIGPGPLAGSQLTPIALTGTAIYYEDTIKLAKIARIVGETGDSEELEQLAAKIKAAFNTRFYDNDRGCYGTGSQCANALPLVIGLVEPENRPKVLQALIDDIQGRDNAVTAGDVGYRYVLRALAEGERSDVIYELNHHSDKPGYGYQLAQGATSLTEAWNATPASSQNHFMLGQIMEWFYHDLCGLAPDPSAPGFKNILIQPHPLPEIEWAEASHESPRGPIHVKWCRKEEKLTLEVEIPANATATVRLPGAEVEVEPNTFHQKKAAFGRTEIQIGSGKYRFTSPDPCRELCEAKTTYTNTIC